MRDLLLLDYATNFLNLKLYSASGIPPATTETSPNVPTRHFGVMDNIWCVHIMSWVEVVEQVQVHLRVFSDAPMELVVDARSLNSSIWADCAFMDEIDLNAIIANETPKHNLAYQYKEGPSNLNGDEQPMKIGYLTPIKCIDHNVDCGDELVNLNADGGDGSDEGVKIENIIDLNFEGSDGVNIENFIDLNFDGGSDERVNIKPSSQTKSFDLNSDSGDDADNIISGSLTLQLALSKYDEFNKVKVVDVTTVFTTDEFLAMLSGTHSVLLSRVQEPNSAM
ncbi:hypothetical protein LguiB_009730 [Lonicera macranthoides]